MKKILFPVDFSKASLNAFLYALHLAKKLRAEIVTLHMYAIPGQDYGVYPYLYVNYGITDLSEFEKYKSAVVVLDSIAENHNLGKINVSHVLREGPISPGILAVAKEEKANYIVMATKGATGLAEVFLGSVAEQVINGADIPVLAVPEGCSYQGIKKILLLTQFKESEIKIMDQLLHGAAGFKAHTDVVEVRNGHKNNEAKVLKMWHSRYPTANVNFSVLISDDPEAAVLKFIIQNRIDLVTLTVSHKSFFEKLFFNSLASDMAYHSVVPLLSFPISIAEVKKEVRPRQQHQ